MSSITVEESLKYLPNRFELSLVASQRAKQLMNGAPKTYSDDKDEKNTVVAIRELSDNLLDIEEIKEDIKYTIKNKSLFKNSEDLNVFENKKEVEIDLLDSSLSDDLDDDLEEDLSLEEDEDYYDNLDTDSIDDEVEEK